MRVQLLDDLVLIQPRAGRCPQIDQHVPGLAGAALRLQHNMLGLMSLCEMKCSCTFTSLQKLRG